MARNRQRARDRKRNLHRENVPGALDHASGEVDEVDAAIVSGADGEPLEDPDDRALEAEALGGRDDDGGGDEPPAAVVPAGSGTPPARQKRTGALQFLKACWAELQRVQWPDRRQVYQATAVVLGFVVIAGAFLGAADYVAKQLVEFIL